MRRVLKPKGFNFFSVRNQNDKSYGEGVQIDKGIYDMNGFQVRFFTEKEIQDLMNGFEILWIGEEYEEPVTLYLVFSKKVHPIMNGDLVLVRRDIILKSETGILEKL